MSFFRSMHKRTSPFFLNAVAIGAHKSVGAVTLVKIPSFSMCLSSDSTVGINAKGIIRAVVKQWGLLRVSVLSCPVGLSRIHVLPNTSRILSTFTTSHMLCATHRRSKLEELLEFLRTNTRKWYFYCFDAKFTTPIMISVLRFCYDRIAYQKVHIV